MLGLMRHVFQLVFVLTILIPAAVAQDSPTNPLKVAPCDLVREPFRYDKKWVEVRGRISFAFEDFGIETRGCDADDFSPIWLEFGGDETTPVIYCCGDHTRKKGKTIEVEGHKIPLVRDPAFEDFVRYLRAVRPRRPDFGHCLGHQCNFYEMSATLTGMYFAGKKMELPGKRSYIGGYGHFGCCHLFVIQRISGLEVRRTPVPAGGQFTCSERKWELTQEEFRKIGGGQCSSWAECDRAKRRTIAEFLHSRGQSADPEDGVLDSAIDQTTTPAHYSGKWISSDLLRTYSVEADVVNEDMAPVQGAQISMAERICRAADLTLAPRPPTERLVCVERSSHIRTTKREGRELKRFVNEGHQPWQLDDVNTISRQAAEDAGKRLDTPFTPGHFIGCTPPGDEFGNYASYCEWASTDAMQYAGVDLKKFGYLKSRREPWDQVPWFVTYVVLQSCNTTADSLSH